MVLLMVGVGVAGYVGAGNVFAVLVVVLVVLVVVFVVMLLVALLRAGYFDLFAFWRWCVAECCIRCMHLP